MIYGRPELTKDMGAKRFLEFYYVETEMIEFCKKNALEFSGSRKELVDRITNFLNQGKTDAVEFVIKPEVDLSVVYDERPIGKDFVFTKKHENYFVAATGGEFVPYEDFLIWLEENPGKTYGEAVDFWYLFRDDIEANGDI